MTQTWTPEEQKQHRKLWVEALRSGKYQQARTALRNEDNGFCCLGVACDVSGLGSWNGEAYTVAENPEAGFLHDDVRVWLGLADAAGRVANGPALYQLNDRHRLSLAQIADIIESEPEGLIAKVEA